MNTHIYIEVCKGSPLDWPEYRHTALRLNFSDHQPPLLAHVVGAAGLFEFVVADAAVTFDLQSHARTIDVGELRGTQCLEEVLEIFRSVPVNNHDVEWNCQTWVEQALRALQEAGWLSTAMYEHGVDGMVDALAEAEDPRE